MNPPSSSDGRILVLEPDEKLASEILNALHEVAPGAVVDLARSLEGAQRRVVGTKPDLFVLDVDATYDLGQDFLYDLRTSHPDARAIILTAVHLAEARERAAGLGAIHFLEKPFPHGDFVDLVVALLRPAGEGDPEKFQGTLSDLHMADIIQLKCMSGATAAIEFTGPRNAKGRVYFENGQVRHATARGKEGVEAFNEIVTWKGGNLREVRAGKSPRSINLDWQILLMEAMRKMDEAGAAVGARPAKPKSPTRRKILVIDDSLMLLDFVKEILLEANYQVQTATTGAESLAAVKATPPDLILLDYILPDIKGNEVARRLMQSPKTARIPVVYMSGLSGDLLRDGASQNVIGFLNKPFTSDLLTKTVETHMPNSPGERESAGDGTAAEAPAGEQPPDNFAPAETSQAEAPPAAPSAAPADEWWSAPPAQDTWNQTPYTPSADFSPAMGTDIQQSPTADFMPAEQTTATAPPPEEADLPTEALTGGAYFCGDTRFFSLHWALQTIGKAKLTGTLRCFWHKEPIELLARNGEIVLATTRDPELYCSETPITLVNVDQDRIAEARAQQRETGSPMFLALADRGLILQEPAAQLVQHYGQRLFSHLWATPRVRFLFEQSSDLPGYAGNLSPESDVDHWALATLRVIQSQDIGAKANYDPASIPAYTRDGFERVQNLRLTVSEAQFASQFNGARSIQQIAKNLRLDLRFARLTLFRFLALDIVELWAPSPTAKTERKGVFQRLSRTIGIGD